MTELLVCLFYCAILAFAVFLLVSGLMIVCKAYRCDMFELTDLQVDLCDSIEEEM